MNGVKFQYASSASVYGNSTTFNEDEFCKPLNPYAFSKYMFDCWLLNQSYPYQGFRYFNVYGLGEEKKGDQASPVFKFIKQASSNEEIIIFENSENYSRDFVCIDDICKVHLELINKESYGIFNIGTGAPISFKDVASIVQNKINCVIKEIPMPEILKGQYQKFSKANNEKILSIISPFNWKTVNLYIEDNINYLTI